MTAADEPVPYGVDISRANVARIYDYLLGGTANYAVDRDAAERLIQVEPLVKLAAWANRGFLQRAATMIVKSGIDQILDLGAGLPTMNNTHQVAHSVNPACKIVYVDSDPEVYAHGLQLVANVDHAYYTQGDLRDLDALLADPTVFERLDFDRPVGILLVGLAYFVHDPAPAIRQLIDRLAPGSLLALSHVTGDGQAEDRVQQGVQIYKSANEHMYPRTRQEVESLFNGLQLLPPHDGAAPGLCYAGQYQAENPAEADDDGARYLYVGVGKKA